MFALFDMRTPRTIRIVLFSDAEIVSETVKEGKNVDLLAVFVDALTTAECTADNIGGIAVIVGVGTFTSTRLAVTVANGFAYARQIPVLAIDEAQAEDVTALVPLFAEATPGMFISATYSAPPRIHTPSS